MSEDKNNISNFKIFNSLRWIILERHPYIVEWKQMPTMEQMLGKIPQLFGRNSDDLNKESFYF
jgi:hypothetical protein